MMIYFYQNKLLYMYFLKITQTFFWLSLRGKTLDWIKFEIQQKGNQRGYTICFLLGGPYVVMY